MCKFLRLQFILGLFILSFPSQIAESQTVLASTSVFRDMARNIAPDDFEVLSIVPRGADPHIYSPTPSDSKLMNRADLILLNGLKLEGWIQKVIKSSGTDAPMAILTDGIQPIESATYEDAFDPHAWMNPKFALTYAENIAHALRQLSPSHSEVIDQNLATYKKKLRDLHQWAMEQIQKIPPQHRVLITSHDAFQYFGRAFGLQLESILGISTDADIQTQDVYNLSKLIREKEIPAIFIESTINPKVIQQIASDNNTKIGGELYADSLGPLNSPAATYLQMIRHNVKTIVRGLTSGSEAEPEKERNPMELMMYGMIALLMIALFFFSLKKLSQ